MTDQPLLLLRLEGPLQSWGLRSRWDVRDTGDEPSKSGIIGLLGCALGLRPGDPQLAELDQQFILGVRVEHAGRRLVDYQTVTGELPTAEGGVKGSVDDPSTIVSPRAYLQDAAFLAVLAGPPAVLERCREALSSPRWPVYLGRKSCPPSRPVFAGLTSEHASVVDALRRHPWDWGGRAAGGKEPERLQCVLELVGGEEPEELRLLPEPAGARSLRADRVPANPTRMYGTRTVLEFSVDFPGAAPLGPGKEDDGTCSSLS